MTDRNTHLIPCRDAVRQLWDFLDGTVPPADHGRVEAHLAFCRRCCGELEFVKQLRELLAAQHTDEVEPEALHRLEHYLEEL